MALRSGLLLSILLFLICLSGCTPAVHIALDQEDVPLLGDLECKSVVIEDEVSVQVDISTGGREWIGGCLGTMIDNAENKKRSRRAEELVMPLLEQTPDVDFRSQFDAALEFTMQELKWLNVDVVHSTAAIPHPDELKAMTRPALYLSSYYALVPKCYSLCVGTLARLWLPDQDKAIFMGRYSYFSEPIGPVMDEQAVEAWAANGAAAYRASLAEGIAEVAKMLRYDLPPDGSLPNVLEGNWEKFNFLEATTNKKAKWTVDILAETDSRIIFREKRGNIWSIPASMVDMSPVKQAPVEPDRFDS